jgi:cytochrome P450
MELDHSAVRALAPRPAHVPEELVFDFDMYRDEALSRDPHARVLELVQTAPPVFWTPRNGGHWMLTSYEANYEAGRRPELFSSAIMPPEQAAAMMAHMPTGSPRIPNLVPIFLDPPEHEKYRAPLASSFSPKTMNALQSEIRALAKELVARVTTDGRCEFMSAIAIPLPVHVFLTLMGLPLDRMDEYRKLANEMISGAGDDPQVLMQRTFRILAAMRETILDRCDHPRDDLISLLWNLEIDGRKATLEDVEDFSLLLFLAGLDTVMMAIGFAARHLALDPQLQARLRADPRLIAEAKEEMLRRYSFVSPPRRVATDGTFLDVTLKQNDRAVLFLPAAGLDSRRFDDPALFSSQRESKAHLAFNSGPHRCLGANLARIELQIIYEELLSGLPQFSLDPDLPPRFACGQNLGIASLNLVWKSASDDSVAEGKS